MTIKQLLQSYPARITFFDRWLLISWDGDFYVGQRKEYARKTTDLYIGKSESKAVKALIGNEE